MEMGFLELLSTMAVIFSAQMRLMEDSASPSLQAVDAMLSRLVRRNIREVRGGFCRYLENMFHIRSE